MSAQLLQTIHETQDKLSTVGFQSFSPELWHLYWDCAVPLHHTSDYRLSRFIRLETKSAEKSMPSV